MPTIASRFDLFLRRCGRHFPATGTGGHSAWLMQMHLLVLLVLTGIVVILLAGQGRHYPLYASSLVVALALFFNLVCFALLRRCPHWTRALLHAIIACDIVVITVFVHFTGGLISLFSMAYFIIIIGSYIFISLNTGFVTALGAFVAFAVLVLLEYYGVVSSHALYDITRRLPDDHLYVYTTVYLSGLLFYAVALIGGQVQRYLAATQTALAQLEKMRALGQLAAGVAHEVNNPLGNISAFLDSRETTGTPLATEDFALLRGELRRAGDTLGKLLTGARPAAAPATPAPVAAVITEAGILLDASCRRAGVTLSLDLPTDLPATPAGAAELKECLVNLVLNAVDAVQASPVRTVTVSAARRGDLVHLSVHDTGPGIAPEHLPHLCEPFYTTKPAGKGTGLGLFRVYSVVTAAGGRLDIASAPGHGTTFTLILPAVAA